MTMKKKLLTTLSVVLILGLAALGILAYLTDTTPVAENVMTTGEVDIEQSEEFVQDTPLYPGTEVDKVVKVTNVGPSDCYTRTLVAFQVIGGKDAPLYSYEYKAGGYSVIDNDVFITVDGVTYEVIEFLHNEKLEKDQVVTSLTKVGMSSAATNDDMTGEYKVLVLSQAVQTAGFDSAEEALNAGFGNVTATMAKIWFDDPTKKVVKVDPSNAQQVLDEIGSGMTIKLTAGDYGTLYFRQSEASTNIDKNYATAASDEVKLRTLSNLTIVGEAGANVDAIVAEAGTYHNTAHSNSTEYPILDSYIVLDNVRIEGITFSGKANAITLNDHVSVDGLTIEDCEMKDAAGHIFQHHFLEINPNGVATSFTDNNGETFFTRNRAEVTVNNCKADYVKRFILIYNSEDLTVTNNRVSNVAETFVNPQADQMMAQPQHTGTMTFTGNTVTNCTDRFIRAAFVGDITIVLDSNTINNPFFDSTEGDTDLVKVNKTANTEVNVINTNNTVNSDTVVKTIEVTVE